jgi:AGCS family alanine or glycine:cation symporter
MYFTFSTRFFQIRGFKSMLRECIITPFRTRKTKPETGSVTPFQALTTALGGTIGTGNIAGVATAIAIAGPGAIFWMMIAAFMGMMTKYAEVVLSLHFRRRSRGEWMGGPMVFIEDGLKMRWLACTYALLAILASLGSGNMVQSNSIAMAIQDAFSIPPIVTGIILCIAVGITVLGGIKKIANVSERLVPAMSLLYTAGALLVIICNYTQIPHAFKLMLSSAFTPIAPIGGFAGAGVAVAMRNGISRGIFTNEAGLGSASIAHATAQTDNPARQGLWGIFEVFFDTLVMCMITALAILVSGSWNNGLSGSSLTVSAFETVMPNSGKYLIAICLTFFAFSSIIAWSYYGRKCVEYLLGEGSIKYYLILYLIAVVLGAVAQFDLVWSITDAFNGLMAIPNLIGLFGLRKTVIRLNKKSPCN